MGRIDRRRPPKPGLPPEEIAKQQAAAVDRMAEFDHLEPAARALMHETNDLVAARALSDEIERKRRAQPPSEGRLYRTKRRSE